MWFFPGSISTLLLLRLYPNNYKKPLTPLGLSSINLIVSYSSPSFMFGSKLADFCSLEVQPSAHRARGEVLFTGGFRPKLFPPMTSLANFDEGNPRRLAFFFGDGGGSCRGWLGINPPRFNSSPWHVALAPNRKPDRLPIPSFFRGKLAVKLRGCNEHGTQKWSFGSDDLDPMIFQVVKKVPAVNCSKRCSLFLLSKKNTQLGCPWYLP